MPIAPSTAIMLMALALSSVALASCGGPRVTINSILPATKLDLASSGVRRVAVPDLRDAVGSHPAGVIALGEDLRVALVALNRFIVLDRSASGEMLAERQISGSGTAAPPGNVASATAIIVGTVTIYSYTEELRRSQLQGADGRVVTGFQRFGSGSIEVSFKLVDVASGQLITASSCSATETIQSPGHDEYTVGERPAPINQTAFMASLRATVVQEFIRQITPIPIQDVVDLEDDSNTPAIARGNQAAILGDWVEARRHFQEAARATPATSAAYYNLGIACRAGGDFPAAHNAFQEAYKRSASQKYLLEIEKTKQFAAGAAQQ